MMQRNAGFWQRQSVFVTVTIIKAVVIVVIVVTSIMDAAPGELLFLIPILLLSVFSQIYVQTTGESPLQTVGRWVKTKIKLQVKGK